METTKPQLNSTTSNLDFLKNTASVLDFAKFNLRFCSLFRYGIENMRPLMWHMSYDTLMSIYNKVWNDKSEGGKVKSNVYTELLGSTGTSASAMAVKEIITSQKYDNCRDAAR